MNSILKNKKKFILVLVLLILFNFCYPRYIVRADEESDTQSQESIAKTIGDISEEAGNYNYTTENAGDRGGWLDLSTNFASLLFFMERGVIGLVNDIFSDEEHKFSYTVTDLGDYNEIEIDVFISPESIIKGKYLLFNADIFDNVSNSTQDYFDDASDKDTISGRTALRNTISGWYTVLRTFSIVALLSVLVYVGIRMIISTVAQDKAKYKVMFKDWLVALCLLIAMHYIMIAILDMSSIVVDAIGSSGAAASQTELVMEKIGTITAAPKGYDVTYNGKTTEDVRAIYADGNNNLELYTIGDAYAYEFLLVAMLFYTILFAIKYLKREFTIMFLILLGPISCITYPIDKISDGKAQAFNKWFAEFLFQVIIQPFHLLIYIVLVGTATQLANDNLLYSIVCFAVMIPAEKFIKEMFGFRDKLGSPLGAMATGAAASKIFDKMKGGNSGGGKKSNSGDNDSTPNSLPPRTVDNKQDLIEGESASPRTNNSLNSPSGESTIAGSDGNIPTTEQTDVVQNTAGDVAMAATATDAIDEATDNGNNGERTTLNEQMDQAQEKEDVQRQIGDKVKGLEEASNSKTKDNENTEKTPNSQNSTQIDDGDTQKEPKKTLRSRAAGFVKNKGKQALRSTSSFVKDKGKQALSIHNQRMAKKWGSTSRGKRWVNRGKRVLGGTAKFATRSAATLAGTAALGALGFMMGQGDKGALAGAALGNMLGNKAIKGVSNTGSDYYNGLLNNEHRENKERNEFKADSNQIDKAVMSYRKNHDEEDPNRKQLNDEMNDRFELSRYGISDDQIDDVISIYQAKKKELEKSGRTKEDAKRIAAVQAKNTAKLAKSYSPKEFMDPNKMKTAFNTVKQGLIKDTKCTPEIADDYARMYLTNAAKMNGVSESQVQLPLENETIDVEVPSSVGVPTWAGSLGIEQANVGSNDLQRLTNLNIRLHEQGLDDDQIKLLTGNIDKNGSTSEIITNFENKVNTSVEYLKNENARNEVEKYLSARGESVTKDNIDSEMRERLVLTETFNINSKKDLNAMRDIEKSRVNTKTQKQMAREMALKTRGATKGKKEELKKNLITELTDGGNISTEKASQDVENIFTLAEMYNTYNEPNSTGTSETPNTPLNAPGTSGSK